MTTLNELIATALTGAQARVLAIASMIEKSKLTGKITIELNMVTGGISEVKVQFQTSEKIKA